MKLVKAGTVLSLLILLLGCGGSGREGVLPTEKHSPSGGSEHPVQASPEASPYRMAEEWPGLQVPWDMALARDAIFFTERPGRIRMIRDGKLVKEPVYTMEPPFHSEGEGGLLRLALDPDFARNGYLYVYHTYEEKEAIKNRVLRLRMTGDTATLDKVLIDSIPGDVNHNGGRIRFGPDGYLYITAGDRYEPALAQDKTSLGGKILRITRDGGIPQDNPFPVSSVYSMGHRNPQGLAWRPDTRQLYASEHGQTAQDEINRIEAGANYGWPIIRGDQAGAGGQADLRRPLIHSGEDTWAPSGMTFLSHGPWKGKLAVAALRGQGLLLFTLNPKGDAIASFEMMWKNQWGRLRSVHEGSDGSLYILTNNRDGRGTPHPGDDRIMRLIPQ